MRKLLVCKLQTFAVLIFTGISTPLLAADWISHRGNIAESTHPENSLEAIAAAWSAGADWVEVDVQCSSDGTFFLFHDRKLGNLRVAKSTFSALSDKSTSALLKLDHLLAETDPEINYLLDIKCEHNKYLPQLADLVADAPNDLAIQSTELESLTLLKRLVTDIPLFWLTKLNRSFPWLCPPKANQIADKARAAGMSGVSLKGRRFIDNHWLSAIRKADLKIFIWTINNPTRMEYYETLDIDGLITDRQPAGRN